MVIQEKDLTTTEEELAEGREFAAWFKAELERRGWTTVDAAFYIGVAHPTINNWLKSRSQPQLAQLRKMYRAFGWDWPFGGVAAGNRWYRQTSTEQAISSPLLSRTRPDASVSAVVAA